MKKVEKSKTGRILRTLLLAITLILPMISISACSLPGLGGSAENNDIVIAGGNTTERQILSQIVEQMVNHYMKDVKTSIINNLGSTTLIYQTMVNGYANVSANMYTGTSLTGELRMKPETDPEKAMKQVVDGYYNKFDMVWFPSYGFENTYAFMVTRKFAKEHGLKTVSDLKKLSKEVKVGVESAWLKREGDGYNAFKEKYGFAFKNIYTMDIGLVYSAVYRGEMDVVLGYSTDGRIDAYDLVLLEDDRRLFPPYDGSPVATSKVLKEHPELETVLLKLAGEIDTTTMQRLNQESDGDKVEPAIVAKKFLKQHNYFEDKKIKPLKELPLYSRLKK